MYKNLFFFIFTLFITNTIFAEPYNPDNVDALFPILYLGTNVGLIGETADILPGNNPQSSPHIPGSVVQLLMDGGDNIISAPDAGGNPTGDDILLFSISIGEGVAVIIGEIGQFSTQCNYNSGTDKIYSRIFNKSTLSSSTYYGQTELVAIDSLSGLFDKWFTVNEYGLKQTKIPVNPADDWVATANAGNGYAGTEGSVIMLDANATTDPDTDLSSLTFAWDLDGNGSYNDAAGITNNYVWQDNGTVTIGLKVSNPISGTASTATSIVTISNANPLIAEVNNQTANKDETFTVFTTYCDVGINDTHTAEINWGDGNVETNITISGGTIELSHIYVISDLFNAELTVLDDDGGSDSTSFTVKVTVKPLNIFVDLNIIDDVHLVWVQKPSCSYQIWFLDGDVKPFNPTNGTWQVLDVVTAGQYHDTGDADGFDNIADSPDDREHPFDVTSRYYCIFEIAD